MKREASRVEPSRLLCTQQAERRLHQYVPAAATDIRATFRRLQAQQQRQKAKE